MTPTICEECGAPMHINTDAAWVDDEDDWLGEDGHRHLPISAPKIRLRGVT